MANVEDYEVLDWVGGGSFGSVSRVRRKRDDVVVCWKRVQYGGFSEAEKRAVVAEVNCLRELHSPFVVRFLDRVVDRKTTTIYIVMEFCEGGDLAQLLDSLRKRSTDSSPCFLEESKLWRLAAQLLLGLHACHYFISPAPAGAAPGAVGERRVILHRDLKPANVLLDKAGNAKLGDFGMSKNVIVAAAASHRADSAALSLALGTPNSMSPEAVNGEAGCAKSDVWALGCVLYEAASLRPPFVASNPMALAVAIDDGHFPRLPERYSDTLANFVSTLLTHARAERPTVGALLGLERHGGSSNGGSSTSNSATAASLSHKASSTTNSSSSRSSRSVSVSSSAVQKGPYSQEADSHDVGPCLPLREALVEARGLSLRMEAQTQLARQLAWKREAHRREAALAAREAKVAEREAAPAAVAEAGAGVKKEGEETAAVGPGTGRVVKARVENSSDNSSHRQPPALPCAHGPQVATKNGRDDIKATESTPRKNRTFYPSSESRVLAAFSSSFSAAAAATASAAPAALPPAPFSCNRDSAKPFVETMHQANGTLTQPDGSTSGRPDGSVPGRSFTALLLSPCGDVEGNNNHSSSTSGTNRHDTGHSSAGCHDSSNETQFLTGLRDDRLPDDSAILQGDTMMPSAATLLLASGDASRTNDCATAGLGSGSTPTGTGLLLYSNRSTGHGTWLGAGITARPSTLDSAADATGEVGHEHQHEPSATLEFATGGIPTSFPKDNAAEGLPVPAAAEERGTKRPLRGPISSAAPAAAPRFLPQPPLAAPAFAGGRTGFPGRAFGVGNNANGGGGGLAPGSAPQQQHRRRRTLASAAAFKPAHGAVEPPRPPPSASAATTSLEVCGHGYAAIRAGPGKENATVEGPAKKYREAH